MDMDGKNYLTRECVDIFMRIFGLETRVARYHNVYGEFGSWCDGREKAPAALARSLLSLYIIKRIK